jgi:chromosomal replication initiator protein
MDLVWTESLHAIKQQVGPLEFKTWFEPLRLVERTRSEVVLRAPSGPFASWVTSQYTDRIAEALEQVSGRNLKVRVVALEEPVGAEPTEATAATGSSRGDRWQADGVPGGHWEQASAGVEKVLGQTAGAGAGGSWNARFTFETYVVGPSNQLAHGAARQVAARPGQAFNPLFLYGHVGLGKTHLLHAVGHALTGANGALRVLYMTAERLFVEFTSALRNSRQSAFRERLRSVDVLLLDDVQFLAKKKATQEELFHTFNDLHERGRQIVFAADRPAREIPTLEERLRSRMEMGLIADLQAPDLETKIKILKAKAAYERLELKDEIARFVGTRLGGNIRTLEGVAVRLAAHHSLTGAAITPDVARRVLQDVIGSEPQTVSIDDIQRVVAEHYQLDVADLTSKRREGAVVGPRHVAMYLCRLLTGASLPETGRHFGDRDHATVIHACQKVEGRIKDDRDFKEEVESLVYAIQMR